MHEKAGEKKRKNVKILMAAAGLLLFCVLIGVSLCRGRARLSDTQDRIDYIAGLGWTVVPDSEEASTVPVPDCGEDYMAEYNELMRRGGFDLAAYEGKTVERYSYRLADYPDCDQTVCLILYVYRGRVIGGDIHTAALDGFMHELCPRDQIMKKQP